MTALETTVTQKGQVTIPIEIRRRLGINPHDRVVFELDGEEARIRRAPSRVLRAFASMGGPPISTDEILQAHRDFERAVAEEVLSKG